MIILLILLSASLLFTNRITANQLLRDHEARVTIDRMIYDGQIQDTTTVIELDTIEKLEQRMRARA